MGFAAEGKAQRYVRDMWVPNDVVDSTVPTPLKVETVCVLFVLHIQVPQPLTASYLVWATSVVL